ncbi:15904_t:CDS:1, partial [Acaulospora morrowiae]
MAFETNSKIEPEKVSVKLGKTETSIKGIVPEENKTSCLHNKVEEFEVDPFIKNLFQYFIEQFNMQHRPIVHCLIRKYIVNAKKNPVKIFNQLLKCPYRIYFTSLVGFFYEFGIGTTVDNKMALENYVQATKDTVSTSQVDSLSLLESFRLHNHYI